jgi:hypothetical protein
MPLELLTMCDRAFLPQALVLHRSLERHAPDFRLRVLCVDETSERALDGRAGVETVPLAELEQHDPELTALRNERNRAEYCWTATPAFCRMALEDARETKPLLWVDADVEFHRDPGALIDELGDGSLLLTPHTYYRAHPTAALPDWLTDRWGRFNGGTLAFRADEQGRAAIGLWRSRSLEWCYDRVEPGRYGNQLHLVDFPARFDATRVLRVPGGGLGPWNAGQFRIARNGAGITADDRPVTFYHHQSLRLYRRPRRLRALPLPSNMFALPGGLVARTNPQYAMSSAERNLIWRPYLDRLAEAIEDPSFEELTLAELRDDGRLRFGIARGRVGHRLRMRR